MKKLLRSVSALIALSISAMAFSVTAQADVYVYAQPVLTIDQSYQVDAPVIADLTATEKTALAGEMDGLKAMPGALEVAFTPIESSARSYLVRVKHGTEKITTANSWPSGDGLKPNNDGRTAPS